MEKLLSTKEVADAIGIAPETVRFWRHAGRGPTVVRVGRYVRYRPEDVESWLDSQSTVSPANGVLPAGHP